MMSILFLLELLLQFGAEEVQRQEIIIKHFNQNLTQVASDGTKSNATTSDYWQAITATSDTPSDSSNNWRGVRRYFTYNSGALHIKLIQMLVTVTMF